MYLCNIHVAACHILTPVWDSQAQRRILDFEGN